MIMNRRQKECLFFLIINQVLIFIMGAFVLCKINNFWRFIATISFGINFSIILNINDIFK